MEILNSLKNQITFENINKNLEKFRELSNSINRAFPLNEED